jgi:hypothetical protein
MYHTYDRSRFAAGNEKQAFMELDNLTGGGWQPVAEIILTGQSDANPSPGELVVGMMKVLGLPSSLLDRLETTIDGTVDQNAPTPSDWPILMRLLVAKSQSPRQILAQEAIEPTASALKSDAESGTGWGFFLLSKKANTDLAEIAPRQVIEVYLYAEIDSPGRR